MQNLKKNACKRRGRPTQLRRSFDSNKKRSRKDKRPKEVDYANKVSEINSLFV
jgi:hypothetical protein